MAIQNMLYGEVGVDLDKNKECDYCYKYLPNDQFDRDRTKKDGLDHRCKGCKTVEAIVRNYPGLTVDRYAQMMWEQEGSCAICATIPEKKLVIDHNHKTDKVRGLLCSNCNSGLGMFKDSPRRLRTAIAYLRKASEKKA